MFPRIYCPVGPNQISLLTGSQCHCDSLSDSVSLRLRQAQASAAWRGSQAVAVTTPSAGPRLLCSCGTQAHWQAQASDSDSLGRTRRRAQAVCPGPFKSSQAWQARAARCHLPGQNRQGATTSTLPRRRNLIWKYFHQRNNPWVQNTP